MELREIVRGIVCRSCTDSPMGPTEDECISKGGCMSFRDANSEIRSWAEAKVGEFFKNDNLGIFRNLSREITLSQENPLVMALVLEYLGKYHNKVTGKAVPTPREEVKVKELEFRIKLDALLAEREGMTAENMQRAHLGQSMAYSDGHFVDLQKRFEKLLEEIPSLNRGENEH